MHRGFSKGKNITSVREYLYNVLVVFDIDIQNMQYDVNRMMLAFLSIKIVAHL